MTTRELTQTPTPSGPRRRLEPWQEAIALLGVGLALAVVVKAFFVQAFYIPSESMEPGLVVNDRILVQKVSSWAGGSPQRGDVVVFEDPGGWLPDRSTNPVREGLAKLGLYPSAGHLVKRVIGVAGDVVECCDAQGRISVNGHPLDEEEYVLEDGSDCRAPRTSPACRLNVGPIPDGYLLVMGDNRARSADSSARLCRHAEPGPCPATRGLVPVDDVVGTVVSRVWPPHHLRWFDRPEVFAEVPGAP